MYGTEPLSGQLDKFMVVDAAGPLPALTKDWLKWCDDMFAYEMAASVMGEDIADDPPAPPVLPEGAVFEVEDWKTKHDLPFGIYVYDHHKKQGNLYRWLLRVKPEQVRIRFVYVSMEGVKPLEVYNGGKFATGSSWPSARRAGRSRTTESPPRTCGNAATARCARPATPAPPTRRGPRSSRASRTAASRRGPRKTSRR
jgi:hypothetical protein